MLSILKGGLISATSGAWITNLPPGFLLAKFRLSGFLPGLVRRRPHRGGGAVDALFRRWAGRSTRSAAIRTPRAPGIQTKPTKKRRVRLRAARLLRRDRGHPFASQLQVSSRPFRPTSSSRDHGLVIGGVSILGGTGTVNRLERSPQSSFAAIGSSLIFLNVSAYC